MATIVLLLAAGVFLLVSCGGGGGGGTPAAATSAPVIAAGTMTVGSVMLNGTRFTAGAGATVRIDDNPGLETELRDGMQVKVKGIIDDDNLTGRFEKVETEIEARGMLENKGVDDFTVNGRKVLVDDLTKIENRDVAGVFTPITFNDLANLNEVEIHGGLDDAGMIRATRVERKAQDALDEVKGTIAAPINATTFTLANGLTPITVNFSGAAFTPGRTSIDLIPGVLVEVHGGLDAFNSATNTFTATRIDFEDDEDAEFEPAEGQKSRIEGFISGFAAHPGTFSLRGIQVRTEGSTKFVAGLAADLADNLKVEAEGNYVGGILVAQKIKFKDSVRIEANVTDVALDGKSFTVLGKTVKITALTRINNGPIAIGDGVKMRGFAAGAQMTAVRVDVTGPVADDLLRGPVTAKTPTTAMTIAGIAVNTGSAGMIFKGNNEAPMSAAAFFDAAQTAAPAMIVKAKGAFAGGTLTASEVELEERL